MERFVRANGTRMVSACRYGKIRCVTGFPITDESRGTRARIVPVRIRAIRIGIAIIREFRAFVDVGARFSIPLESSFARAFEVSWRIDAIGIVGAIVEPQRAFVFREWIAAVSGT